MSTDVGPPLELVCGYPRLTLTPSITRVSVPAADSHRLMVFATAALLIRTDVEKRCGTISQRWTGKPRITCDGNVGIVMADRNFRRRHKITIAFADIEARLRDRVPSVLGN